MCFWYLFILFKGSTKNCRAVFAAPNNSRSPTVTQRGPLTTCLSGGASTDTDFDGKSIEATRFVGVGVFFFKAQPE